MYLWMSPSVWRVWIEIIEKCRAVYTISTSPSVWRVWIEIKQTHTNRLLAI